MVSVGATATRGEFVHEALLYRNEEQYRAGTLSFIDAARAADEPVLVAVPFPNAEFLRSALDETGSEVQIADMAQEGRNPGRIIATVLRRFMDHHAGRRVAIIGEPIWAGRSGEEYAAAVEHEALINLAFAGRSASILCPYNESALDPRAITDAHRTHPVLRRATHRQQSASYAGTMPAATITNPRVGAVPHDADRLLFDSLPALRAFLAHRTTRAGLDRVRATDLQIALGEVATNTLQHGGGMGLCTIWEHENHVVCEVHDQGHITDPLAGRRKPTTAFTTGRGLRLVHLLCDLVQAHSDLTGTTVRLWMRLGQ